MRTIISLGGSLIIPEEIDTNFLKQFRKLILSRKESFVIYCGGGSIARNYQKSLSKIIGENKEALDWMGISATYLNAFLLRCTFYEESDSHIIEDPTKQVKSNKKIILACGWKPGWSTDYDAILLAKNLGSDTVINMSNIDYVYDSDPKKNPNAKPLKNISWKEFKKLVGNKWKPGLNMPFDPIAAKQAEKLGLKVIIIGKDLKNLEKVLDGKEFKGTIIK